ncbi:hypothetical protein [uncultured Meiothermus sp.]|jgi:hypothetical protein|uniref:hypothetical protein n=1 Tax=uncultured Meiothermus sp. TaxID=157471 RepID=UPI002618C076|nr:hypothetical protein [uncultured Meiothermus sp.]
MAWKLETWNPEYALPERMQSEEEQGGLEDVKTHYEGDWAARSPAKTEPDLWPIVYLVDGRQRIDAQIADSGGRSAMLAKVIAGAVLRDGGGIRPVGEPLKRDVLLHSADLVEPLPLALQHYQPIRTRKSDPASMRARLTEVMRGLEASLVNELEGGLVVMDGQIFPGEQTFKETERILGYTKTQAATYLGPEQQALLHRLKPFERTPIFSIPGYGLRRPLDVFSWYVRLPLSPSAPFYGGAALLRVETPTPEPSDAVRLADLSVSLFGALASSPARDPRAPQNLIPIGGLEQWLGRHMGHGDVVRRKIVQALFG